MNKITEVTLSPLIELLYTDEAAKNVISILKRWINEASPTEVDLIYKDINKIELRVEVETIQNYIDLFSASSTILDFAENKMVYVINEDKINALMAKTFDDIHKHYDTINSNVIRKYLTFIEDENLFTKYNVKYIDSLVEHKNSYHVNVEEIANFYGNFSLLIKDITKRWHQTYIIININSADRLKRLKEYCLENMIKYQTVSDLSYLSYDCINIVNNEYILALSIFHETPKSIMFSHIAGNFGSTVCGEVPSKTAVESCGIITPSRDEGLDEQKYSNTSKSFFAA